MDKSYHDTTSGCPVCDGSRWWLSRIGLAICHQCHPDPMVALQALGDQTKGHCRVLGSSLLGDRGDNVGAELAG